MHLFLKLLGGQVLLTLEGVNSTFDVSVLHPRHDHAKGGTKKPVVDPMEWKNMFVNKVPPEKTFVVERLESSISLDLTINKNKYLLSSSLVVLILPSSGIRGAASEQRAAC